MQGKSAQKCGPRPLVPRNRRNSSRVRSECAGAGPLGPRGRGTAAAGRVDGARRARAQIPGGGKGFSPCTVHPSGGRRASPPWTQGTSPGAFGPHARAVTAISWDRRPRTTFLGTFALQPVGPRKAQKNHSKTLNIDLSLPDRPRLAVVSTSKRVPMGLSERQLRSTKPCRPT